jgi:cell division protein FtsL
MSSGKLEDEKQNSVAEKTVDKKPEYTTREKVVKTVFLVLTWVIIVSIVFKVSSRKYSRCMS